MNPVILASGSPRRRQLLGGLGVLFEVMNVDVIELDALTGAHLAPFELARENGRLKARAAREARPECWVLGADTVVALGERLFGKPASLEEAREFLGVLSGQSHEVITGCVLISPEGEEDIFHEVSTVAFHDLSPQVIDRYLAEVNVLDKAGAYALQEQGERIVRSVKGSRTNVIGLPMEPLALLLKKRGLLQAPSTAA
jgi:septum formation protein